MSINKLPKDIHWQDSLENNIFCFLYNPIYPIHLYFSFISTLYRSRLQKQWDEHTLSGKILYIFSNHCSIYEIQ